MAIQPDGKIVAGGIRLTFEGTDVTWVLARYTADGRLDTTFDGDGSTSTPLINAGRLDAVAVDADGRIYAAGSVDNHVFVGRFTASGQFDTSFGNGGVFTKFGTADEENEAFSIVLPQPGKVLVVGAENEFSDSHNVVAAEYLDDGSLDPSFGTGGVATFDTGRTGRADGREPHGGREGRRRRQRADQRVAVVGAAVQRDPAADRDAVGRRQRRRDRGRGRRVGRVQPGRGVQLQHPRLLPA